MNFVRTDLGLSNMHRFLSVDYVVFIEGGNQSLSIDQIIQGRNAGISPDMYYWRCAFNKYSKQRVSFKSVGSKSALVPIAHKISAGDVKNILVSMDRDFDCLNDRIIESDGIFYTWGYSWENDVFHENNLIEIIYTLSPLDRASTEQRIRNILNNSLDEFHTSMRRFVLIDALLSTKNLSLFPRPNANRVIIKSQNYSQAPVVDTEYLKNVLASKRSVINRNKPYNFTSHEQFSRNRFLYGHLYFHYIYHLLMHIFKTYANIQGQSPETLFAIASSCFLNTKSKYISAELNSHHLEQFRFLKD